MIHAYSGIGGDARLFPPPWDRLPGFRAHDWPEYRGESSLADVARRVVDEHGIADGDVVVGASLGGMVAGEIAGLRRLRGLLLVGSAVHPREINRLVAALHPLADLAPLAWIQAAAAKVPWELADMFARGDAAFIRRMCRAVFEWKGLAPGVPKAWRIHGRRDAVIPPPAEADLLLDAGHLVSWSHPAACVEFLEERVGRA